MGVSLRTTKLKGGRKSYYVDVYQDENNNYRETLGLYLDQGTTPEIVEKNRITKRIAEKLRAKLELELLSRKFGETDAREEFDFSFLKFFDVLVSERFETRASSF